jgi:hypothetical protein
VDALKGVSDLLAATIFIGLALVASTVFILVLQGYYAPRTGQIDLSRMVSSEKSSISVRLLDVKGFYATVLFKRFQGDYTYFFIYDGASYEGCNSISDQDVYGGRIESKLVYSLNDIVVVGDTGPYSFPIYARTQGLPRSGNVVVCKLLVTGNTIIRLKLLIPIADHIYADVIANKGSWRLYGVLRITLSRSSTVYINWTQFYLPPGTVIELKLNTSTGDIIMSSSSINVIELPSVESISINYTVLPGSNHRVRIRNAWISSYYSTLSTDIQLEPGGLMTINYDSKQDTIRDNAFIRLTGLEPPSSGLLYINLGDVVLHISGLINAIFMERPGSVRIDVFIVTIVGNRPVLVDKYTYNLTLHEVSSGN